MSTMKVGNESRSTAHNSLCDAVSLLKVARRALKSATGAPAGVGLLLGKVAHEVASIAKGVEIAGFETGETVTLIAQLSQRRLRTASGALSVLIDFCGGQTESGFLSHVWSVLDRAQDAVEAANANVRAWQVELDQGAGAGEGLAS